MFSFLKVLSFFTLLQSLKLNMEFSSWSWIAALLCLICMAGEVQCDCTRDNVHIEGGEYTLTRQLASGSMLVYKCKEGYYPYPVLTRVCQPNGRWNPEPPKNRRQKCRLVECPDPNVLADGEVSPPQEKYFVHNETTYECYAGYTLRGSARRVCLPNGKWGGYTPICSRDSTGSACSDPGVPPGASRSEGNSFDVDDVVKYTCNTNLFLVGSKERQCRQNGQWSGIEPACYFNHTYDTTLEVSQAFGSAIMETLTTLEDDDTQQGRKIRISKDGILNIYIAVDISESIEKKYYESAKHAIVTLIDKIASFSVTPNYEILFFSSEVYEVVNIVEFMDDKNKIAKHTIKNKVTDFVIAGRNTGTDVNGAYSTILERIALIKQRAGTEAFKEHRHVLIFFTDGAYNMGGSPLPTVARIKNMVYMDQTDEDGSPTRKDYLDMYVFAIGAEIDDNELQPLITQKDGEKHYFRLQDITDLHETFDLIIDESKVEGLCGLHKIKSNVTRLDSDPITRDTVRKFYPWFATISIKQGRNKCFGSLVSPKFILTAAHCFKFGDEAEDIRVQIDDGHGIEKKAKTFYLHKNYNISAKVNQGVKEFYDYDIALIQLVDAIEISAKARPICIPCTKETSDALQLVGETTCKQQEEILFKTHIEQLTFLSKKQDVVKEKDVRAKLGDNRDECIKHALKAEGITTKDPKVAVTENFLCTGGIEPYVDDKSCKGDSGGAVFKNYEYRMIQVGIVSWGTKDCEESKPDRSDKDSRDFHINLFRVMPFLKEILGKDTSEYAPLTFLKG